MTVDLSLPITIAAINGDDGGESCLGGVRGSSRERGREMNCIAHSRTRTQVEVASDSTVRDDRLLCPALEFGRYSQHLSSV